MKKRTYRAVDVKKVNVQRLAEQVGGERIVVGVDIGKEVCFGCLTGAEERVYGTIKWRSPGESRLMVEVLKGLGSCRVEVAIEPSGSYGDAFRHLLWGRGIPVYRVSAKRSHDATEVYDGVPSSHDAKSAAIIAKLHRDGASELWPLRTEAQRDLRAMVITMDLLHQQFHQGVNRLEAQMARYWPEVGSYLDFSSVTFLSLIQRFGGPEQVAAQAELAVELMRTVGGRLLKEEKIQGVVCSCRETIGVCMSPEEVEGLRQLAEHTLYLCRALRQAKRKVEAKGQEQQSVRAISAVLGKATAAVLVAEGGDPRQYGKASQWVKTFGLNLKERSSGKHMGRRRITKRGSGKARRWLYLGALRLIRQDPVVQAWYQRKVRRDGNVKMKAIIAIMRKYVKALWHVAQGKPFDSTRLFDTRRLGMVPA